MSLHNDTAAPEPAAQGRPDWVNSQRRARRQCERCGEPATAHVTWTGSGKDEVLCRDCLDAAERKRHKAMDRRLSDGGFQ